MLKAFPLRLARGQSCPLAPFLFNVSLDVADGGTVSRVKFVKEQNCLYSQMTWLCAEEGLKDLQINYDNEQGPEQNC